jgi:multiple sugar transport system permease protein
MPVSKSDRLGRGLYRYFSPMAAKKIRPYIWVSPTILVLGALLIYPWLWCFWLSFHSWTPLRPGSPKFIFLGNYITTLTSPGFWNAVLNTINVVVVSIGISFILGFGLALLLSKMRRGRGVIFVMLLLPMMLPQSMVGLMWKFFFHTEYGIFNWLLSVAKLRPVGWLADPKYALLSVNLIQIWVNTPFVIMIIFAGLQSMPIDPHEAALIDGANSFQRFWYITIPMLKPLIVIVLLFRVMHAVRTFDAVYSLFRSGGPGKSAEVIGVYLYETYRITWQLGLSSAIAIILLCMTVIVTLGFSISTIRHVD